MDCYLFYLNRLSLIDTSLFNPNRVTNLTITVLAVIVLAKKVSTKVVYSGTCALYSLDHLFILTHLEHLEEASSNDEEEEESKCDGTYRHLICFLLKTLERRG